MDGAGANWSTQQLVEFLDLVSSSKNASVAAERAVERAAEALEAEVAAIVRGRHLVTSIGFPRDRVPEQELVASAHSGRDLDLDRAGPCTVMSVPIGNEARLLVARIGEDTFNAADANLLHGFGGALDLAFRILESQRLKDEFFALVSHELRTPLTSIVGYLDVVAEDPEGISDRSTRALDVVHRNAKRLQRLVGDLLFSAQVNANKFEIDLGPMDLEQIATQAVEAAQPNAASKGIDLASRIDTLPRSIGDASRISQAIDNLISNALKFTPAGGRVELDVRRVEERVAIAVRDTGIGIPTPELPHLFDRFYRSSNASTASGEGAGLGLAIVKAIVEGHNGTIGVESEEGFGTTIEFDLPLHLYLGEEERQNGVTAAAPELTPAPR